MSNYVQLDRLPPQGSGVMVPNPPRRTCVSFTKVPLELSSSQTGGFLFHGLAKQLCGNASEIQQRITITCFMWQKRLKKKSVQVGHNGLPNPEEVPGTLKPTVVLVLSELQMKRPECWALLDLNTTLCASQNAMSSSTRENWKQGTLQRLLWRSV